MSVAPVVWRERRAFRAGRPPSRHADCVPPGRHAPDLSLTEGRASGAGADLRAAFAPHSNIAQAAGQRRVCTSDTCLIRLTALPFSTSRMRIWDMPLVRADISAANTFLLNTIA